MLRMELVRKQFPLFYEAKMWTYAMEKKVMEDAGIDAATSRMQSARSTIWANPATCQQIIRMFY